MTVYFSKPANQAGAKYDIVIIILTAKGSQRCFYRDARCLPSTSVSRDGQWWKRPSVSCKTKLHEIRFSYRPKVIATDWSVNVNELTNISTAIVWRETTVNDPIHSVFRYVRWFVENYTLRFFSELLMDRVEDMMSSTSWRQAPSPPMLVTFRSRRWWSRKGVLPLPVVLAMDTPVVKSLGITHID